MGGVYGDQETKELVQAIAGAINVGAKLVKGGGLLTLFELLGPFGILRGVDFTVLKKEISELDAAERKEVEQAFASSLKLEDPALQQKFLQSADALNDGIDLVQKAMALVEDGKALLQRVKTILGV